MDGHDGTTSGKGRMWNYVENDADLVVIMTMRSDTANIAGYAYTTQVNAHGRSTVGFFNWVPKVCFPFASLRLSAFITNPPKLVGSSSVGG